MSHSRRVVEGKAQRMVQTAQRELERIAPVSLELAKRLRAVFSILSVRADREIQITGELPQRVVFRFMQPFALREQWISHRYRAQFLNRPARFLDHLPDIGPRHDRHEL